MNFRICAALAMAVLAGAAVFGSAQSFAQYAAAPVTLFTFDGSNGANPAASLVADAAGNLWGTTYNGGYGYGEVFELAKTSTGYANTITRYRFTDTNGANPTAGLIKDTAGNLFGTTYKGGDNINEFKDNENFGTVFEIEKTSTGYKNTIYTLVNFRLGTSYVNQGEGAMPWGGLVLDANGNLYGTTIQSYGNYGTVFEIEKTSAGYNSTPVTWNNFSANDGEFPEGSLIINAGSLFGTTYAGTTTGAGAVFEINLKTGVYSFLPFNGADGENPVAGVIADAAGNLFGTTYNGGKYGYGEVFEIAKTSTGYASPTPLHSFDKTDGANPQAGLIKDAGNLFGTTVYGGKYGYGTVFELVKNAAGSYTFTRLVSFNNTDGAYPLGGVILDAAGDIFGTTSRGGGANNDGTVFELKRE